MALQRESTTGGASAAAGRRSAAAHAGAAGGWASGAAPREPPVLARPPPASEKQKGPTASGAEFGGIAGRHLRGGICGMILEQVAALGQVATCSGAGGGICGAAPAAIHKYAKTG